MRRRVTHNRVIHNKVTLTTAILIHIMPIRILITATHTPFTAIGPSALGSAGAGVGFGAGAVAGMAVVGAAVGAVAGTAVVGVAARAVVGGAADAAVATGSIFGQRLRHGRLAEVTLRMRRAKPLALLDQGSR